VLLCVGVGCGGSSSKKDTTVVDPAAVARDAAILERKQKLEAMKPASPYEVRENEVYRPSGRCGQGPYRLETESLRAKYSERMVVYACGKHAISGNYSLTTTRPKQPDARDEAAFGFSRDNAACKGREVAVVTGGGGDGIGGGGGKGMGKGGGAAPAMTSKPIALERATVIPEDCVKSQLLDHSWLAHEDGIAMDARFVVDVWSDEPNDLEGLVFVIEKSAVVAGMTVERWRAYMDASTAYHKAFMADLELDVAAGRTRLIDNKVKTPPPPPARIEVQPPRPSKNARWIPGYWLYEETAFHWITGLWDVPEEDVVRELTVQAPTPPPATPANTEPTDPRPTRTAVWTPGSWQWDGRAYIWVVGAWRIPPDAQSTWQRPTWNINRGRAIYVPGGWRVRVRLR